MTQEPTQAAGETLNAILDHPDLGRPALIVPDSGQVLTYAQLADRVEAAGGRLAAAGVRRGDRVALTLPNGPDFVLLLLAITALGAAAAPLNPAYTHSRVSLLPHRHRAQAAPGAGQPSGRGRPPRRRRLGTGARRSQAGGDGPPELLVAGKARPSPAADFEPGGPDDVAVVLHTSGTTSRPKQVPLRQRNLMASTRTIAAHYRLGAGRRLVLRDAAVPRPRAGRLDVRGAGARAARSSCRAGSRRAGSGRRPASTARPGCRRGRRCTR